MRMFKNKKGFTLVELIIVISILAVLAAIAVPIAGSVINSANTSSDNANVALYQSAIEKYAATAPTNWAVGAIGNGGNGNYLRLTGIAGNAWAAAIPTAAQVSPTMISPFVRVTLTAGGLVPAPKTSTNIFVYNPTAAAIVSGGITVAPHAIASVPRAPAAGLLAISP